MMKQASDLEFFDMFDRMRQRNVSRVILRYSKYMLARIEQLSAEYGYPELKPQYMSLLANIGPHGAMSSELARCIWISKQAISKMLKEVEAHGFITYRPHESDGRAMMIHLTERGRGLLATSIKISEQIKAEMKAVAGEENIEHLIDTMNKLLEKADIDMGTGLSYKQ
jgi:DNA-binding MarR family transcriptional regulator